MVWSKVCLIWLNTHSAAPVWVPDFHRNFWAKIEGQKVFSFSPPLAWKPSNPEWSKHHQTSHMIQEKWFEVKFAWFRWILTHSAASVWVKTQQVFSPPLAWKPSNPEWSKHHQTSQMIQEKWSEVKFAWLGWILTQLHRFGCQEIWIWRYGYEFYPDWQRISHKNQLWELYERLHVEWWHTRWQMRNLWSLRWMINNSAVISHPGNPSTSSFFWLPYGKMS